MAPQLEHDRREFHYVVALPRLFGEALDARDCDATRAPVAWRRMSSFGAPADQRAAAIRPRVSCSRPSLTLTSSWYPPRLRSSSGGGATRVTAPIRELIHNEERFRIAVIRSQVVDGETGILLDSLRLVRC
jgi:hypothetical protein